MCATRWPLKLMPLDEVRASMPPNDGRLVRNAQAESSELHNVTAVGRELTNLLTADQRADFAGFGLHLQGLRLNGDALFRTADCQGRCRLPRSARRSQRCRCA